MKNKLCQMIIFFRAVGGGGGGGGGGGDYKFHLHDVQNFSDGRGRREIIPHILMVFSIH